MYQVTIDVSMILANVRFVNVSEEDKKAILTTTFDLVPLNYHYLVNSGYYNVDLNQFIKNMNHLTVSNISDTLYECITSTLGNDDENEIIRSDTIFHDNYNAILWVLEQTTWVYIQAMRRILPIGVHFKVEDSLVSNWVGTDVSYQLTLMDDDS